MAVYDIIPDYAEICDVRDTLNANNGVAGNSIWSLMTPEANTNGWAKFKPVFNTDMFADITQTSVWQGIDGKCGFSFNAVSSYTLVEAEYAKTTTWKYKAMTEIAGLNVPKRLGDYRGYYPKATPPISGMSVPGSVANGQYSGVTFTIMKKASYHANELKLSDFGAIKDGYFGVYITNGSQGERATAATKIEDGGTSVELSTWNLPVGDWKAIPFIATTNPMGQDELDRTNSYTAVPELEVKTFKIVSSTFNIKITATKQYVPSNTVLVNLEITAGTNGDVLENNSIALRYTTSDKNSQLKANEQYQTFDDWTIDLEGTFTKIRNLRFNNVTEDLFSMCKVVTRLDNDKYVYETYVMQES